MLSLVSAYPIIDSEVKNNVNLKGTRPFPMAYKCSTPILLILFHKTTVFDIMHWKDGQKAS